MGVPIVRTIVFWGDVGFPLTREITIESTTGLFHFGCRIRLL